MPDYSQGKIYKIQPIVDHEENEIYIGSTTVQYLCIRMGQHKRGYNSWKTSTGFKTSSYDLFDKYGIENCIIILLEEVNANSKDELKARERFYIESNKCINKYIPSRTGKETKKIYYESHKEETAQYQKKWREENKELKKEMDKQYRENNKEKIKERKSEKFTCECGKTIRHNDLARHKRSQFHINNTS